MQKESTANAPSPADRLDGCFRGIGSLSAGSLGGRGSRCLSRYIMIYDLMIYDHDVALGMLLVGFSVILAA